MVMRFASQKRILPIKSNVGCVIRNAITHRPINPRPINPRPINPRPINPNPFTHQSPPPYAHPRMPLLPNRCFNRRSLL
jgi:hypothetical protein